MPTAETFQQSQFVKLILMGDSGTGKTSALAALVAAGYKVRVMNFDNLLEPLVANVRRMAPKALANLSWITFRDKLKTTGTGADYDGSPMAFLNALKAIDNWKDGDVNLGPPQKWGADCVLVIDSWTRMSDAALNWADFFMVKAGAGGKDGRAIVGEAQRGLENVLNVITADYFETNVIVIAHLTYQEQAEGLTKGYPKSAGQKLSPNIPTYFSSMLRMESSGAGAGVKRVIRTLPTTMVDLKNPAFADLPETLPLETGLATFFEKVKGKRA